MKIRVFLLLFYVFCGVACTKADPDAYKSDPILLDYLSQQSSTLSMLETLKKEIESTQKDIRNSVPQSGQYGASVKKLHELEGKVDKLNQQLQFWKIRIEGRAREAQIEYLEAYKNKKEWPNKVQAESYFAEKRLRMAKMQWDQKDRIEQYHKKNHIPKTPGEHETIQNVQSGGH